MFHFFLIFIVFSGLGGCWEGGNIEKWSKKTIKSAKRPGCVVFDKNKPLVTVTSLIKEEYLNKIHRTSLIPIMIKLS